MTADKIVAFLNAVSVTNAKRHKRTGWIISSCPLQPWRHENGKSSPEVFGVKIGPQDPLGNCFACGWHGKLGALVQTMKGLQKAAPRDVDIDFKTAFQIVDDAEAELIDLDIPGIEDVLKMNKESLHVFPDWWLDAFPPTGVSESASDYLDAREVPNWIADALDLRWDPQQKRICFPVRDFKHRLVGLHGRATLPETEPRYRMYLQAHKNNPIAWLGEDWVDVDQPIVVVEGPFDLASVARVYKNVVSPLFANPSFEKLRRMSDALEWVTLLDHGTGGDKGRQRITDALGKDHVITHLKPPEGRKDPGEMTVPELVDLLSPHVPLAAKLTCVPA